MNSNGLLRKHWFQVTVHFLLDMGIFALCYYVGSLVVFKQHPEFIEDHFDKYLPAFAFTSIAYASAVYITGLYSSQSLTKTAYRRFFLLGGCVLFAALTLVGSAYVTTARPLGRSIMLIGTGAFALIAALHHTYLLYSLKTARERVAYIVQRFR